MWFVGHYTAFGRHLYAIGGNPEAARRAGISVGRIIVIVFVVAGFLAALGGVLKPHASTRPRRTWETWFR